MNITKTIQEPFIYRTISKVTNSHIAPFQSCLRCWNIGFLIFLLLIATISKMGWGKWDCVMAVSVFFHLLSVIAQPGFLSISCGGNTTHTGKNNITWVSDANYIDVGVPADIGNATLRAPGSYLQTLRFFPKPLRKACYHLPLVPNLPYLLRLWFAVGNYSGLQNLSNFTFAFSIETLGMLAVQHIPPSNLTNADPFSYEEVFVSSGRVLYICLIRTSETNDPFISAIELRALRYGMYQQAKPGTMLTTVARTDFGGNKSFVRYPQDEFDRLWRPAPFVDQRAKPESSKHPISASHTQNIPPSFVMQTAYVITGGDKYFVGLQGDVFDSPQILLLLYFADIEPADMTLSFSVSIEGLSAGSNITLARNYSALETQFLVNNTESIQVFLSAVNHSTAVILNALEYYAIILTQPATYSKDIEALQALKTRFSVTDWISDPCYLIEWKGIVCDNSSSSVRISEINLSGWNLTGPVPDILGELTALVSLSLENNHLTGPLPDFSNLSKLERLHLQNNNLTGSVPHWLCRLENLQELFIENNSFSGVIPCNLFNKHSLKFRYSGNRDLHIPSNPNKNRWRLLLGIILSVSLVIGLVLIAIIVVRHKKFKRKQSNSVEKDSKDALDEDTSSFVMPNTAKSRAFTLEEITEATQNFSQKIGEGGFGSVFLGKLQHGKDIAVKVLSMFSKQGVQEFLNEVDLLSKIHHKNLVSLLGYCKESRELMLVYEYMSGGSLKDHLYGRLATLSPINWITRLKIALDAAEGLEYLHLGCTTRIIHRDIKSANILLDKKFNGKLADFGLSRMTIDGEASHVTTTVKGTLGYLDPEYFSTQMLTEKSDVYSFGVVLLEMICGRQPIDANLPEEQLNLIRWVTPYVEMDENPGKMVEIVDKRLGRNYDIESITVVAKLAIRSVQADPSSRPSVHEIVAELKKAIKLEKDKVAPISDIGIEYGDLDVSLTSLSVDSSVPKEMDSTESSSNKFSTLSQGR